MKIVLCIALFFALDVACFRSVPTSVRLSNPWAAYPTCGYILAAQYHFGFKLKG